MLEFEPIAHRYRLDGVELPSVTTILKGAGMIDYSMIPQDVLQNAARRGTAVHKALEYLDREELDEASVSTELAPYIEAYKRFCVESGFEVALIENRLWHPLHRYAGTLDRTGLIGQDLIVLDFKTGMLLPGHALQLAAYTDCMPKPRRFRRIALQLKADATYNAVEFPSREFQRDVEIFLSALACFRWQMNNGRKGQTAWRQQ